MKDTHLRWDAAEIDLNNKMGPHIWGVLGIREGES